jgi:hypothetical protein
MSDNDILLAEVPISLGYTHLSQAIDLYLIADSHSDWRVSHGMTISSIIHSYCAIESTVNTIAYGIFRREDHPHYIAPIHRSFLLKKCLSNWKTLQFIDKFCLLFDCAKQVQPSENVLADLRELNNLRNWIVHGFVYKKTLLLEKTSEGEYEGVDEEDEINWLGHFPKNHFNPLDQMDERDARKVLLIALRALALVQVTLERLFVVTSNRTPSRFTLVTDTNFDFSSMLDRFIEQAKSAQSGV